MIKLNIITRCTRPDFLEKVKKSIFTTILFDIKWWVVFDTRVIKDIDADFLANLQLLGGEAIFLKGEEGDMAHSLLSKVIDKIEDGFIYFLDDDTIVHPTFWSIVDLFNPAYFYTFDQLRDKQGTIFHGNDIRVFYIDTAMYVVHKQHVKDTKWRNHRYNADGHFICDIYDTNMGFHKYIKLTAAYYNYLV